MISRALRPLLVLGWAAVTAAQTVPTFQTQFLNLYPNEFVTTAAIGDVDGDGRPEVASVDNNSNTVRVARVRTDGTLQILAEVPLPTQRMFPPWLYFSMKIVDMNGDGKKDITCWQRGNNLKGRLYLLEQSSNLSFNVSTFDTPDTDAAYSMDIADLNGDGLPDLITANHGYAAPANLFVTYNGTGPSRFASFDVVATGTARIVHVYAADLNRDSRPDVLVTTHPFGTPGVRIMYNTGTGLAAAVGISSPQLSFTIGVGDLNNDGQPDIVATDGIPWAFSNAIRLYRALGTGYSAPQTINTPLEPRSPRFGDFNRDGLTDMMLDNSYDRTMSVYLGSPTTNDINLVPIVLQTPELAQIDHGEGSVYDALLIGDVDGDGDDDGLYTGSRLVWIRNGPLVSPDTVAPSTSAVASPDVNIAGWRRSDVTVALAATDNPGGSGVKQVQYSLTGAQSGAQAVPGAVANILLTAEGMTNLSYFATDNAGNVESARNLTVLLDKTAPSLTFVRSPAANTAGWNNTNVTLTFSCTDPLSGVASRTPPVVVETEGAGQTVPGTCVDVAGNVAAITVGGISIDKTKPAITSTFATPNPVAVGASVSLGGSFADAGGSGLSRVEYSVNGSPWQLLGSISGAGATLTQAIPPFAVTGVYSIRLIAYDTAGNASAEELLYLPVFDPQGGFVTGGGWIQSPAGALTSNPAATGKATFGFVSRYQPGANVPSGNTQFQFHAGDFRFQSTAYDWLVVAGKKAQFKGTGTVNGSGEYQFLLTAIDGDQPGGDSVDRFRLKVTGPGGVEYDNQMNLPDADDPATVLGGGSIVIRKN